MQSPKRSIERRPADVAVEVIDGEAVIMHLRTGAYYTMDGVGAAMWTLLDSGESLGSVARIIAERYGAPPKEVAADVARIADELVAEDLMVYRTDVEPGDSTAGTIVGPAAGSATDTGEPEVGTSGAASGSIATAEYSRPRLVRYDDMADLLALDPPLPPLGEVEPKEVEPKKG